MVRKHLLIKGIVQGVGFRPFIYNLAAKHGLKGWVLNSTDGVHIEVEGEPGTVERFISDVPRLLPPLAKIDTIDVEEMDACGYTTFEIKHSEGDASKYVKISPDVATCPDCLRELMSPSDRRYLYPFINCTNCGPRFTIIRDIPYDRAQTTMSFFKMCPDCQAEYDDPTNRRFHAQPNACHVCGPHVWLERLGSRQVITERGDALVETVRLLSAGKIVAIKGLGGFHLACDATNGESVAELRRRKQRNMKPFAVMAPNIETIREFCEVSEDEAQLLTGYQRPIVLLRRRNRSYVVDSVAPNNEFLGVMLPYTPVHHLLFMPDIRPSGIAPLRVLVMTSGNMSEEPIVMSNEEAREKLSRLADFVLLNNRDICTRCDDSVAMINDGQPVLLRRSRGYAPHPIDLDIEMPQILGCGPELKATFCLTRENHAFLSQHIGDLQNAEALAFYESSVEYIKRLFRIEPKIIAHDMHPDYLSTRYAMRYRGKLPLVPIQHHHAHVASSMAENGLRGEVIGIAFDGTGYGTDGNIWGGEFLIADERGFSRYAHLRYLPMPGGDAVVREPGRMALSYLISVYGDDARNLDLPPISQMGERKSSLIKRMIERNINAPMTSSVGRLFDAVSSILDVCQMATYDAQPAIELEMTVWRAGIDPADVAPYSWEVTGDPGVSRIVDVSRTVEEIVNDFRSGEQIGMIAARFHRTVSDIILALATEIRSERSLNRVILSGGVFQNRLLLTDAVDRLRNQGFEVFTNRLVPPNDGGVSLGQIYVAASRFAE